MMRSAQQLPITSRGIGVARPTSRTVLARFPASFHCRDAAQGPWPMLRDINSFAPDRLAELANKVRDLIWKYGARARFRRMIQKWRAEDGEGPTDLYGPLPDRPLTLIEKHVLLAAIHDQCCKGVTELNPWPDFRKDPAKRAARKRRQYLTHSEIQWNLASTPFYFVRHGVHTSMPESDAPHVEQIIREVEEDLREYCQNRGKGAPSSITDETNGSERPSPPVSIDETAYVLVSKNWPEEFQTYSTFKRWLDGTPKSEVRRRKPSKQRLEIHAGDWNRYWTQRKREQSEALDGEALEEFLADAEATKLRIRKDKRRK